MSNTKENPMLLSNVTDSTANLNLAQANEVILSFSEKQFPAENELSKFHGVISMGELEAEPETSSVSLITSRQDVGVVGRLTQSSVTFEMALDANEYQTFKTMSKSYKSYWWFVQCKPLADPANPDKYLTVSFKGKPIVARGGLEAGNIMVYTLKVTYESELYDSYGVAKSQADYV